MVFLEENRLHSWLWPLRRTASGDKKVLGGDVSPAAITRNGSESPERAFDIADSMEKGMARELVTDFLQPLPDSDRLWRFRVERSEDRQRYRLFCDGGDFLLFARVCNAARRVEFFLYDPDEKENNGLYDPDRPAFTMSCSDSAMEWRLVQERSAGRATSPTARLQSGSPRKQELASVWHDKEQIGGGISHCMDACIPREKLFPGAVLGPNEQDAEGPRRFASRSPTWSDEVGSLVLDFKGRQVMASAKNFQIADEDDPDHVVCQYGKLGPNTFGLDFKYPLNVVQAFGISLTTLLWS